MDWAGVLIAVLIRALAFQLYSIPVSSMAPTLVKGDTVVAAKFAYGYSRYSPPNFVDAALALRPGRIFAAEPRRGDLVVFKLPSDGRTDYVKRLIGLPGEKIQMIHGRLSINGALAEREPIAPYRTEGFLGKPTDAARYVETLPGGVKHEIVEVDGDEAMLENTEPFEVPPGHYFVIGDNRDNSLDSRIAQDKGGVGFVPRDNLEGRITMVLYSTADAAQGSTDSARRRSRWFMAVR